MYYVTVNQLLAELSRRLQRAGMWCAESPPRSALASSAPFCCDTLVLEQWLQFVFLPKMNSLVTQRLPLPKRCGIAAMAEQVWATDREEIRDIVMMLRALDGYLTKVMDV